jgi:PAS domain S-box-containing protein
MNPRLAYVGLQQVILGRRLLWGRLSLRLTVLALVTTLSLLAVVVVFVDIGANASIEQGGVRLPDAGPLVGPSRSQWVLWGALAFGVAMLLTTAWSTVRQVYQPIDDLTDVAAAMADGELTRTVTVDSADELGTLGRNLNHRTGQLRALINGLEEERNLLRTLIDSLPASIFVKDLQGRYVLANAAHTRLLGADAQEEVVGRTDLSFFSRETTGRSHVGEQAVMQSGLPLLKREELIVDLSGEERCVLSTKVPLKDCHGHIVGLVGMYRDVTQRKQAAEVPDHGSRTLPAPTPVWSGSPTGSPPGSSG